MASYSYGPPPPAPPPAQPTSAAYPQYPQPYQPIHGGHMPPRGGGGRGGHGRGGFYSAAPYGFNSQPQPQLYPQPVPNNYPGPQAGFAPQQWQHDQTQGHAQQQPAPVVPLAPQNYHPNFAPQMFQMVQHPQQQPQPQQPQPQPQPQQPYIQEYDPRMPSAPPPPQHWGAASQPPGASFGHGRGRGGHYNDRGAPKSQLMGPPIRLGFDGPPPPDPTAPVSNGYPAQSYTPSQGGPVPYPAGPYQGFPPMGRPLAGPQRGPFGHKNGRPHGRGGLQNNSSRGRSHFGGDKMRSQKPAPSGPTPNTPHQKPDAASSGKKKKRKMNTLGLTPGDESDDDVDEESKLQRLIGPDAPNPTDLAAWLEDRKKNFPTQARIKAKLVDADKVKVEGGKESASSALEKQQQKAERLRKQLEKVESSIKRKREQQDEGDEMRGVGASTSVSSDSQSDDEAPESLPSRPEPVSSAPPPPPQKKADPSKHCKYFSTGGTCGKKLKCRFVHDQEVREKALKEREMNGGRMTLQQRLILNDKDQEDLTIIKTLQYLKEKGMMKDHVAAAESSPPTPEKAESDAPSPEDSSSLLPPPPAQAKPSEAPPATASC